VLRLYTHAFSIVPWRVRIALHEKGLDYETVVTDLHSKQPEPGFLALNPFAQIPVLDDEGFIVAESMAILEYLEEKHPEPALMPSDLESRATVRKWMCWGTDYWPPAWKKWMAPRLPGTSGDSSTPESVAEGRREICHHLDVLQRQLVGREWLVNDYSLADICYAPFVLVLEHVELGEEIARRPAVDPWVDRKEHEAWQEIVHFTDRYARQLIRDQGMNNHLSWDFDHSYTRNAAMVAHSLMEEYEEHMRAQGAADPAAH